MELQGSPALIRSVGRRSVVQPTVPEQNAPGPERTATMRSLATSVSQICQSRLLKWITGPSRWLPGITCMQPLSAMRLLQGDPHADDLCVHGQIEVRVVLVPGFFAADAGRFLHGLVAVELGWFAHHAPEHVQQARVPGQ